jgi:hypothetical protein
MWLPNVVLGLWGLHATLRACELGGLWPRRDRGPRRPGLAAGAA